MNYYNPYSCQRGGGTTDRQCVNNLERESCAVCTGTETALMPEPKSGCRRRMENPIPKNAAVAMAYVPFQSDFQVYDCQKALKCGTLFPELNKPFTGCCRYE